MLAMYIMDHDLRWVYADTAAVNFYKLARGVTPDWAWFPKQKTLYTRYYPNGGKQRPVATLTCEIDFQYGVSY